MEQFATTDQGRLITVVFSTADKGPSVSPVIRLLNVPTVTLSDCANHAACLKNICLMFKKMFLMFISCVKCPCNFMLSVTSSSSSSGGGSSSNEPNDEIKLHLLCGKIVYSVCFAYLCCR